MPLKQSKSKCDLSPVILLRHLEDHKPGASETEPVVGPEPVLGPEPGSSSSVLFFLFPAPEAACSVSAYELPSSLPSLLSDLVLEIIISKRIAKAKTNKLDEDLSRKSRKLWPTRAIFLNTFLGWALTFITFEWFTLQKAYA